MPYNHISQPQSFHDRPPPPKHLNAKQAANWRRANNKSRYNEELRNSKNPFNCQPWLFDIVFVDYTTTDERLAYLLETTKNAASFTIDTESTRQTGQSHVSIPSLIQVEIISATKTEAVIIFECSFLPSSSTSRFDTIKLIWQNILDRHKVIKGWGNPMLELQSFLTFQMFTHHQIDRPVTNVQNDYTLWNE
ncbi:unnamed protein product, partial [Didymodactylos carnosus]